MSTVTAPFDEFSIEQKLNICLRAEELLEGGNRWIRGEWISKRPPRDGGKQVDCYCLDGALAVAAVELGYVEKKRTWRAELSHSDVGRRVSVFGVIKKYVQGSTRLAGRIGMWNGLEQIYDFNDSHIVDWEDIEAVLQKRIRQLKAKLRRETK